MADEWMSLLVTVLVVLAIAGLLVSVFALLWGF